jgi:outer membrane protein assembly factor BamB
MRQLSRRKVAVTRQRACAVSLFLVLAATKFPGVAVASDWPQWRGPESSGISRETGWSSEALGAARVLWRAEVGKGFSSFSVVGNRVYTMGNASGQDTVYCLDAANGKVVWKHSYPCRLGEYPGPRATPTVQGQRVYTLSQEGDLHCLDRTSGRVVWNRDLVSEYGVRTPTWGLAGSVKIVGELILLNAGASGLALRVSDGARVWSSGPGPGGYATPVVFERDGRAVAAIFGARALSLVDAATGKVEWTFPWVTSSDVNAADPLLVGDRIFISSNYGKGCALLEMGAGGPRVAWQNNAVEAHFSNPVYLDGRIYALSGDARRPQGRLVSVDAATGETVWSTPMGFGAVTVAGDRLIACGSVGPQTTIVAAALGTADYRELARTTVLRGMSWNTPTLADGRLYVRNLDGQVLCLDLR